jgi:hypothetical protein
MRRVCLALTFVLLLSSASLAAEWVLWTKHEYTLVDPQAKAPPTHELRWEPLSAWYSEDECEHAKKGIWEVYAKECDQGKCPGVEKVDKVPYQLVQHFYKESRGSDTKTLYCIFDTVDPRDKKE